MNTRSIYTSILLLFTFFFSVLSFAQTAEETNQYTAWVNDIQARLDRTAQLYQDNQIDDARTEVQMAYFEVFENLEGPIRINYSAKKSYSMEATFGEIRKMITQEKPLQDVLNKINGLKAELTEVLPRITDGHKLNAEGQHGVYGHEEILPYWQQSFQTIDDFLANAVTAYQAQDYSKAKQWVQQSQYQGYKNSEMEMSVRTNRTASESASINQQFYDLIRLAEQPDDIANFGYHITLLLQDIEELLPGLPPTRDSQVAQNENDLIDDTVSNQDWAEVAKSVNTEIQQAIALFKQGQNKKAILAVQDAYFDIFENTGMENKIGARDVKFKVVLEAYFTRLVSLMKANAPEEQLQEQAQGLALDLEKAVDMLTADKGVWVMFIYSFMIIFREGLEALLIVAAIVTYLIKNNHQDKLVAIRQSVYVALAASVVTAIIFQAIFSNAGASRELLEGFTMLIAVVMLFMMSYWLLSKVEAKNWKRYLEGKLSSALTTGSLVGLWLTSFLAVYREGAETVLFYYALASDVTDTTGYLYLFAGFFVGVLALAVCYFIMRFTVVKLPLKPFFMFTGCFMYLMAFVFAGKGILELVEGKLFQPTLLQGFPEITWLGIYPYVETLIPQIILVIAAVFALFYMKWSNKKNSL